MKDIKFTNYSFHKTVTGYRIFQVVWNLQTYMYSLMVWTRPLVWFYKLACICGISKCHLIERKLFLVEPGDG